MKGRSQSPGRKPAAFVQDCREKARIRVEGPQGVPPALNPCGHSTSPQGFPKGSHRIPGSKTRDKRPWRVSCEHGEHGSGAGAWEQGGLDHVEACKAWRTR